MGRNDSGVAPGEVEMNGEEMLLDPNLNIREINKGVENSHAFIYPCSFLLASCRLICVVTLLMSFSMIKPC